MVRWRILKILLFKEARRYYYNSGLLIMVGALLILSFLFASGNRLQTLPGQGGRVPTRCLIFHDEGSAWAEYLEAHVPTDRALPIEFWERERPKNRLPDNSFVIHIQGDKGHPCEITYYYLQSAPNGLLEFRDWFINTSKDYLGVQPLIAESTVRVDQGTDHSKSVALILTGLVIFSIYLPSLTLYITSTAEEREKGVLLALLLSPITTEELILAKTIFYCSISLLVSHLVVFFYNPALLLNPFLPIVVLGGSLSYLAIGTVIVSMVRKQSMINSVPMLYLMIMGVITFLGEFIGLFSALKVFLVENYLHHTIRQIITGNQEYHFYRLVAMMWFLALGWTAVSIRIFRKRATDIAHRRL